ncbi:MAG: hypothetical protein K2M75_03165 [Clostridia bacterium]|nr:hypothetical protein [Clostridia bacterium]
MAQKKKTTIRKDSKLPNLTARLEAVKGEYQYLQNTRNALQTRTGILIALLSGLISVAFIRETVGIVDLFKTNLILAHFRVILLVALFISFFIALISYICIFFTHEYAVFPYENYVEATTEDAIKTPNENVIVSMYKDYAACINHNQPIFEKLIKHYRFGNKWLIVTIVFTVLTLITTLI